MSDDPTKTKPTPPPHHQEEPFDTAFRETPLPIPTPPMPDEPLKPKPPVEQSAFQGVPPRPVGVTVPRLGEPDDWRHEEPFSEYAKPPIPLPPQEPTPDPTLADRAKSVVAGPGGALVAVGKAAVATPVRIWISLGLTFLAGTLAGKYTPFAPMLRALADLVRGDTP